MKTYDTLLFDADGTLLDFDRSEDEALKRSLQQFGLVYTPSISRRYHEINDSLWKQFELGQITREQLQATRFATLLQELDSGESPIAFNLCYRQFLSESAHLIPGAISLCETLYSCYTMAIVTNGIAQVQRSRLIHSGLGKLFKKVYISEGIGWQKPDKRFFEYVFSDMGISNRSKVLLIGDSLTSDIQGGINAGVDTCWYSPISRQSSPATYRVSNFHELFMLLQGHSNLLPKGDSAI